MKTLCCTLAFLFLLAIFSDLAAAAGTNEDLNRRFVEAVRGKDADGVRFLLAQGASADAPDDRGWTGLMYAAHAGDEKTVTLLLRHGAQVNARNKAGVTPLILAALSQNDPSEIVGLLLRRGAAVNARDHTGGSALNYAVDAGNRASVRALLRAGAQTNMRGTLGELPLSQAVRHNDRSLVQMLLRAGASVNATEQDGTTPLLIAAGQVAFGQGDPFLPRLLLQNGANVNAATKEGTTPLLAARDLATVKLLLDHGADVRAHDRWNRTAFVNAVMDGDLSRARLLLARGATVRDKPNGEALLLSLVREMAQGGVPTSEGRNATLRLLIRQGVNVNARDAEGQTPLMIAAGWGRVELVALLLDLGARVNLRDRQGRTALGHAEKREKIPHAAYDVVPADREAAAKRAFKEVRTRLTQAGARP
jgi:ankyrin repeat protein